MCIYTSMYSKADGHVGVGDVGEGQKEGIVGLLPGHFPVGAQHPDAFDSLAVHLGRLPAKSVINVSIP